MLIVLAVVALGVALLALSLLGRGGVLNFPLMRRRGVNLMAVREESEPAVWLVAHVDSKWQPVSMIARVVGVIGSIICVLVMLGLALAGGHVPYVVSTVVLTLAWLSAFPLLFSVVGGRNHGTLDNASGVAAVLAAAERLASNANIGILITDAEEFALAGARAWARTRTPGVAINCDSIDDDGQYVAMFSRRRPQRLTDLIERAGRAVGETVRVRRMIPGMLMDSFALAEAGWETVTLSRGNVRTLQRIHTSRDTLAGMRGTGIAGAARILTHIVSELG
jgi:hypothetical protein